MTTTPFGCDCTTTVVTALKASGVALQTSTDLRTGRCRFVLAATRATSKRAVLVAPAYCPFCGRKEDP